MGRLLTGAGGAMLLTFGTGGLLAPKLFTRLFGLPTEDPVALSFARVAGARDIVLGALVFASLDDRANLRRILAFSSLVGLADGLALLSQRGLQPQHVFHFGGLIALASEALALRE